MSEFSRFEVAETCPIKADSTVEVLRDPERKLPAIVRKTYSGLCVNDSAAILTGGFDPSQTRRADEIVRRYGMSTKAASEWLALNKKWNQIEINDQGLGKIYFRARKKYYLHASRRASCHRTAIY